MWLLQQSQGQNICFEAMVIILTREVASDTDNASEMLFLTTELDEKN